VALVSLHASAPRVAGASQWPAVFWNGAYRLAELAGAA
jgi:hypothetical protein